MFQNAGKINEKVAVTMGAVKKSETLISLKNNFRPEKIDSPFFGEWPECVAIAKTKELLVWKT